MKKILLLIVLACGVDSVYAQSLRFNVQAMAHRDMQTEQYGNVQEADFKIKYEPYYFVTIGADTFKIVSEKDDLPADSSGYSHKEMTTTDSKGQEYIISIASDPGAKAELMRNFVIKFSTAKPYDWTYFFTEKPERDD